MDLKRISKTGRMTRQNIVRTALISVAAGTVALGGISYHNSLEENRKLGFSSNYKSYSAQIEELFHVDISEDKEESLNKLEDISLLIDEYKEEENESKKASLMERILEERSNVEELSLYLLKNEVAKENGGKWSDYHITPEKADGTWQAFRNGDVFVLDGDLFKLANAIGNFQALEDKEEMKEIDDKKVINGYENIIKRIANFIKNTSKKAK